jgi:hypothetical protein
VWHHVLDDFCVYFCYPELVRKNFLKLCVLTLYIQLFGSFFATFVLTASSWTISLMVFSLTPNTLSVMFMFRISGESSVSSSGGIDLPPRRLSPM